MQQNPFKNNVIQSTDQLEIYDTVIHNPTAEEKNILDGITFKEKNEYHYKVDDKYVYYLKEDLEKNRPLVQDGIEKKDRGKVKRVSENLPVGAISKYGEENMENTNIIPEEWDDALRSLQPTYLNYMEKVKKIVDQRMYDGIQEKENIVVIGKTEDFVTYLDKWKKLTSCS